jgi:DNA-binding response OmpR family regulator
MATVLLINRNAVHRRVLSYMLRQHQHTVVAVTDSLAAMEQAARRAYDLMIVDLALQGVEDLIVLQRLRGGRATRTRPILVVTDNGREADRRAAIKVGASMVLAQPFSVAEIGAAVRLLTGEGAGGEDMYTAPAAHLVAEKYRHEDDLYQRAKYVAARH